MLSALLDTIDLMRMFIKRQGRESSLPCQGVFLLLCQRWWLCSRWLQCQLFCSLPWKMSLALRFCGHIKVTPHPLTGGGCAVRSECEEAFSHTAADGFGFGTNSHGNVRESGLGQAEDSCAPSRIFPLIVLGASETSWVILPVWAVCSSVTKLRSYLRIFGFLAWMGFSFWSLSISKY